MTIVRSLTLLIALAVLCFSPVRALAQPAGPLPGIVATGTGVASEPAQSATLQFLVASSMYFGMGPSMMETIETAPGTPDAVEEPSMAPGGSARLTEDQLGPVVDALVAAGADQQMIEITIPAATGFIGPGGPDAGEISVMVDQPDAGQLTELVNAARDAASSAGFEMMHIGVLYEAADCVALLQQARDAAIADAQARAEGLAASLDVTLGELAQASESPFYGPPEAGSCAPEGTSGYYGPYGPGTFASFDARATEATVTVQVTLTYAFGEAVQEG